MTPSFLVVVRLAAQLIFWVMFACPVFCSSVRTRSRIPTALAQCFLTDEGFCFGLNIRQVNIAVLCSFMPFPHGIDGFGRFCNATLFIQHVPIQIYRQMIDFHSPGTSIYLSRCFGFVSVFLVSQRSLHSDPTCATKLHIPECLHRRTPQVVWS